MKIVTYNLRFLYDVGNHYFCAKEWVYTDEYVQQRVDHISATIADLDADVLCLQEIGSESVMNKILNKIHVPYYLYIAEPDDTNTSNAIISKKKPAVQRSISTVGEMPVFSTGDTDSITGSLYDRRQYAYIQAEYDGKPLHVFSVHLKANFLMGIDHRTKPKLSFDNQAEATDGLIRSEIFRLSQAKKIRQEIDAILEQDPNGQVIVAGDLNSRTGDSAYRIVKGAIAGRNDTLHEATASLGKEKEGAPIDHILVSKALSECVEGARIYYEKAVKYEKAIAPNPNWFESDHAPLEVILK